jgi:methylphosphotriester-DNA--protein-cysteine methyltransferase
MNGRRCPARVRLRRWANELRQDPTLTMLQLAEREGYDADSLSRWLKSVDYNHAQVMRQRLVDRLETAVAVLEAGGLVADAADAADMNAGNLCRAIKRHYGVTPVQIRQLWLSKRINCLFRMGLKAKAIARILGWSPATVRRIAERDGWAFNGMEWVRRGAA